MDFIGNIRGCLIAYGDTAGAAKWLSKASAELGPNKFHDLLVQLHRFLADDGVQFSVGLYVTAASLDPEFVAGLLLADHGRTNLTDNVIRALTKVDSAKGMRLEAARDASLAANEERKRKEAANAGEKAQRARHQREEESRRLAEEGRTLRERADAARRISEAESAARALAAEATAAAASAGAIAARHGTEVSSTSPAIASRAGRIDDLKQQMLHQQTQDGSRIRGIIEKRRIPFLVHFTRIDNLSGIAKHGIAPRASLTGEFVANDESRLDGYPEASCLSVGFPNYRMLFKYQQASNANWAVIKLRPDLLLSKPCLFFATNAASGRWYLEEPRRLMGADALEVMFAEPIEGMRAERGLRDWWPFDPQAEILAFDVIKPSDFLGIQLLHADDQQIRALRSEWPQVELTWAGDLFKPRSDYANWQRVALDPAVAAAIQLIIDSGPSRG